MTFDWPLFFHLFSSLSTALTYPFNSNKNCWLLLVTEIVHQGQRMREREMSSGYRIIYITQIEEHRQSHRIRLQNLHKRRENRESEI